MSISRTSLRNLADMILNNIKEDFKSKKLSGNLVNTIQVQESANGIEIIIPARTYNMLLYQTKNVIVYNGHGSYASKLDEKGSEFFVYPYGTRKGSFKIAPRNHKNFVEKAISNGLNSYLESISENYQVISQKDTGE